MSYIGLMVLRCQQRTQAEGSPGSKQAKGFFNFKG